MTSMSSVLVWTIVVGAAGLAMWWLLADGVAAGRWLLAAFLAAHGLVHVLFATPAPAEATSSWAFDTSRSWVTLRAGADVSAVRLAGQVMLALTVAGFLLAALSTMGWLVPIEWWEPLVVVASVASATLLGVYFNAQLILGLGIDVVLLWLVLADMWSP